ncbi:MAG: TetR family transcriptional regulator [Lachnospiraceae bacterium]|nr:TetR family transcriptional regulator [Lachnospiraceae bacterium]
MAKRKTDRRTIYTKNVIRDSLLALLTQNSYEKITVTSICKQAEITRATFYLHYNNIDEVLDELLDDALRMTELDYGFPGTVPNDPDRMLPVCQRATSEPKYRVLFLDESMSHILLNKLYQKEKEIQIPRIMQLYHVSEWEADKMFLYMLHGSFAVNKSLNWEKNSDWYHAQSTIQALIRPKK